MQGNKLILSVEYVTNACACATYAPMKIEYFRHSRKFLPFLPESIKHSEASIV